MSFAEQAKEDAGLFLTPVARMLWERYGDERKLANAKRLRAQTQRCTTRVEALPWRIVLETQGNLSSRRQNSPIDLTDASEERFKPMHLDHFLADLWPYLVEVNLLDSGEAFLNQALPEIVSRIHGRGVGTHVQSNLSDLAEEIARGSIDGGLDFIVASIDGASQDVYSISRRDSLHRVLKNLEKLVQLRGSKGSSHLQIVWRYQVSSYNLHEIDKARKLAAEIGVDDFVTGEDDVHEQVRSATEQRAESPMKISTTPLCTDLWDSPIVCGNGTLTSCCAADNDRGVWGNLNNQSWHEAYNTSHFQSARRMAAGDSTADSPCLGCARMEPMRRRYDKTVPLQVFKRAS